MNSKYYFNESNDKTQNIVCLRKIYPADYVQLIAQRFFDWNKNQRNLAMETKDAGDAWHVTSLRKVNVLQFLEISDNYKILTLRYVSTPLFGAVGGLCELQYFKKCTNTNVWSYNLTFNCKSISCC